MTHRGWFRMILLACFAGSALAQQKPQLQTQSATRTATSSGAEMYRAYCAVCHGADAKGNGPAAPALKKLPPDLTLLSRKNGGKFPATKFSLMLEGDDVLLSHGSRDMPIWGPIFRRMGNPGLGEQELRLRIRALSDYVSSLQQK